jgi:predicted GNAT superfamily acetyltransferase
VRGGGDGASRGGERGGGVQDEGARKEGVLIRALTSLEDFRRCVELQKATWGEDFEEKVPTAILRVASRYGGVVAGAFPDDSPEAPMVGFIFGLTGIEEGRPVHWSDMLAVRESWRRQGVGRALKTWQRDHLRSLGVHEVRWSFDPLEAANARLNLVRLGAVGRWFIRDMYGESNSKLHAGQGTDRLIVSWWIGPGDPPEGPLPGRGDAPPESHMGDNRVEALAGSSGAPVRVPIPPDFQRLRREDPEGALRWRRELRQALEPRLAAGWVVCGVDEEHPETGEAGPFLVVHPPTPEVSEP